jgi:hypothetical protein
MKPLSRTRQFVSFALLALTAGFGLTLAGGLELAAPGVAAPLSTAEAGAESGAADTASSTITPVRLPAGLPSFAGHTVARTQMSGFGGMLSFEIDDRTIRPRAFLDRLRLIRPAVSLGGVETTICAPAETSHAKLSATDRQRIGISDALLRLSVGVEHAEDLIATW